MKGVESKRSADQRDAWKERVDIGKIMSLMAEAAEGTRQVNPSQINAAALVLDRFIPRLSSIVQTERNELDTLSREDILGRIQALRQSDLTLLPELVALQAREVKEAPANVTVV